MGLRFRRSIKIAPGIRVNFSKTGIGLSAGVRGARMSVNSHGRVTRSVGVPGTGVFYTKSKTIGAAPRGRARTSEATNNSTDLYKGKSSSWFLTFVGVAMFFFGVPAAFNNAIGLGVVFCLVGVVFLMFGSAARVVDDSHQTQQRTDLPLELTGPHYKNPTEFWIAEGQTLAAIRETIRKAFRGEPSGPLDYPVMLKADEVAFSQVASMLFRGSSAAPDDTGALTLTTARLIFTGPEKTIDWTFDKIITATPDDGLQTISLSVSNRQTVHQVRVVNDWAMFKYAFEWAMIFAKDHSNETAFMAALDTAQRDYEARKPVTD